MYATELNFLRKQIRVKDDEISRLNDDREKLIAALHIFGGHNDKHCVVCEWLRKEIYVGNLELQ